MDLETVGGWITFGEEAEEVINNWRSAHRYPLQVVKTMLKRRANQVDAAVFVSSRTKRIPAIKSKLSRSVAGANPRLSQMQDIGGCRAVLRNVALVRGLVSKFSIDAEFAHLDARFDKEFDYISQPKRDGYRSHHLVFRYESDAAKNKAFIGLRIEVQIRSLLQHQWATAVETVDFFTGQQLKSNSGDRAWKRFFVVASAVIAFIEGCPPVPGTPGNPDELREALAIYDEQMELLRGYSEVTETIERSGRGKIFLLEVDPDAREVTITAFRQDETFEADRAYIRAEEALREKRGARVALVSVDSFSALRKAYPNYFLDARDFVATIDSFLKKGDGGGD